MEILDYIEATANLLAIISTITSAAVALILRSRRSQRGGGRDQDRPSE